MPIEILVNGYEADLTADIAQATAAPFDIDVSTLNDIWGVSLPDVGQFRLLVGKTGSYELMVGSREGAASGKVRILERGVEGSTAIAHSAADAAIKVQSISTKLGLMPLDRVAEHPPQSAQWIGWTFHPYNAGADEEWATNRRDFHELLIAPGKHTLTSVGFQIRTTAGAGVTAAEMDIYKRGGVGDLVRQSGGSTDISSVITSVGWKSVNFSSPITVEVSRSERLYFAIRIQATTMPKFRIRTPKPTTELKLNAQGGGEGFALSVSSGALGATHSPGPGGTNATDQIPFVGVK